MWRMGKGDSNYHDGSKNRECYFCDEGPPLNEHHIIPQRFDGPDTKDNIVELCESCHKKIERLYNKSFYEWFGIEDESGERKYHRQCENSDCENRAKVKVDCRSVLRELGYHRIWNTDGFRCRPCTAKLGRSIADRMEREYQSKLEDFYDSLERIHREARKVYDSDRNRGSSFAERKSSQLDKPQELNADAESILDEIVVEEADEQTTISN